MLGRRGHADEALLVLHGHGQDQGDDRLLTGGVGGAVAWRVERRRTAQAVARWYDAGTPNGPSSDRGAD